jgi:hypothetical protein
MPLFEIVRSLKGTFLFEVQRETNNPVPPRSRIV